MDTDDSFPTGDRRHGPVSVDDPNFGEKINLILNEVVVINGEALHSRDSSSVPTDLLHNLSRLYDKEASMEGEDDLVEVVRGETAVNEFHNTDTLLYLSFPCEFPLGKGLPEGLTGVQVDLGRHLFLQHGNGCAQDT